jgi:hypothetical protein
MSSRRSKDPIPRLRANDPARGLLIDEAARRELWLRLLAAEQAHPTPAPVRRRRFASRPLALLAPALLVLTAAALAAGGVIRFGSPAKLPFSIYGNAGEGYGALVQGTTRLLPISAPDPAGGLPWGMRELSTSRGQGCLQIGRLLDGKLGALGADAAFHDDGRFHELPVQADYLGCALLDGKGRLFANVTAADRPASAWIGDGGRLGGCVPDTAGPYEKGLRLTPRERKAGLRPAPICKQRDLRNIYYGLLGPQAQSITYVLAGQRHTLATVGPQGAYLFVTRASSHQLLNFANAGSSGVVPVDGPIREIHYRDGSTCHLTHKSWIGGRYACTPSLPEPRGYVRVGEKPTLAQVASPVHVRLVRARHGGGRALAVSFTARLPVVDTRRVYSIDWRVPGMPAKAHGGESTNGNIAAGQKITKLIEGGPYPLHGLVHGKVVLQQALGAGEIEGPESVSVTVGSFAIRVACAPAGENERFRRSRRCSDGCNRSRPACRARPSPRP